MTPNEAIRKIKQHNEVHRLKERNAIFITKALDMAIEALEKQIPKKLICVEIEKCCPVCKEKICLIGDDGNYGNYCYNCGQALDWSDEE